MSLTNGIDCYGDMVLKDGKFYGATAGGGNGYGVVFEWNPETNLYLKKVEFHSTTGSNPYGILVFYEGKFFGTTSEGGQNGVGTIFSWEPISNIYKKEFDLSKATGYRPLGSLLFKDDYFYGLTSEGGDFNFGTLIKWKPSNGEFDKLKDFTETDGISPRGTLTFRNGKLSGLTYRGGANNFGTIFEFDIPANNFIRKHSFNDCEGKNPTGPLTLLNNKLYGVTGEGGINNAGTIFEFDPFSREYSQKFNFKKEDGVTPYYGLVSRKGKLYGVTTAGGQHDLGVIFEWDPISNVYTKKHSFNRTDGACPVGLVEWRNKFYGVTTCGGENPTSSSLGVIFEWDPELNVFLKKLDFQIGTGHSPRSIFTLKNDRFYGVTNSGGPSYFGGVYEWDPETNALTKTKDWPIGLGYTGLTFVGESFYGLTYFGGASGNGSIFKWDVVNNTINTVYDFNYIGGAQPLTKLTSVQGKLYGTTNYGGKNGMGTIFEWQPSVYTALVDLDKETGHSFFLGELTPFPALVSNGIDNDCLLTSVTITQENKNQWVPIVDTAGNAIAELNANGNILGKVNVSLYINTGSVRVDSYKQLYMDRNITITPENKVLNPGSSVDIRLYVKKNEFESLASASNLAGNPIEINNISQIGLFKSSDVFCNRKVLLTAAAIKSSINNWNQDYVFTASVQSFSTFYFANNNYAALPVRLVGLTAKLQEQNGIISWKTAHELNFSHFEIERSDDGKSFKQIGSIVSSEKDAVNEYKFIDTRLFEVNREKVYYRLKMVDIDGRFAFSSLVYLSVPITNSIIYPNPAHTELNIQLKDSNNLSWQIVNSEGREVSIGKSPTKNFTIDIRSLPTGIYHFIAGSGEHKYSVKFLKIN